MSSLFLLTRPQHDYQTEYLFHWAEDVLKFAEDNNLRKKVFSGKDVVREDVESFIVSSEPRLIIFNGHGGEKFIGGHDNKPIIDVANIGVLRNTIVYAIACDSSKLIGPEAVKNGTDAFIGYREKFAFVYDPNRVGSPIKDKRAEPFRQFSNSICIALLEGKDVGEAQRKALNLGNKLIRDYSTSDSEEVNEAIRFFLFRNMELLRVDGNMNASFS